MLIKCFYIGDDRVDMGKIYKVIHSHILWQDNNNKYYISYQPKNIHISTVCGYLSTEGAYFLDLIICIRYNRIGLFTH
jgi:hypothetical protein